MGTLERWPGDGADVGEACCPLADLRLVVVPLLRLVWLSPVPGAVALCRLLPGPAVGTHAHPGSTNALVNYKLPMPSAAAILVILAWAVIPAVAGAWRTRTQDA
jgi:hypothetical protein